jgi:hypothetical protein
MAVSGITGAELTQSTAQVQNLSLSKAQTGTTKAETVNSATTQSPASAAQGTPGIASAENNAGREQSNPQHSGAQDETGPTPSLYA